MKAHEFVRKYGWDAAAVFLSFDSDVEIVYTASFFDDLKRLVESHELSMSAEARTERDELEINWYRSDYH